MLTFTQSCHANLEVITNKIRNSLTASTGAVYFNEDFAKNTELYSNKQVKKSVSLNLLDRLSGCKEQIVACMYDFG